MDLAEAAPIRAPAGTVDDLLQTAERLFARDGVENVALTQIVAQAGQRNRSALHYHFGARAGVLTAVLNRRLVAINARREAMIDALPADPTAAEVLHAEITPLAQVALEEPWGADYLSILAQVVFHPQLLGEREVEDAHLSGLRRGRALLERAAPPLSAATLDRRVRWFKNSVVFALARWMRDTPPRQRTAARLSELVDELVAYGAAGLTARAQPTSREQAP
ncbi:MAG TPA: TetR family transcriptional regulator [Caulobacteraceae bacterium]|nr:TetR family transcriptional regulator [Caulobacteraceae bacterium]